MNTKITVSGNIISELSEKIPTNIIALNELIKNSYDAGATTVTIELNTRKKLLRIIDDGSGMNKKDIDILFLISKSTKKHGAKNEYGRITQGSKGLGFLSVFKFGKHVEWKTNRNKGLKFSVDFDQLIKTDDISKFEIELFEDNNISKGTEILIKIDDYNVKSLNDYFSLEKNYKKIIHSFDDKKFIINLIIDEKIYSSKKLIPLFSNVKECQLFYITYSNETEKIIFKYNNRIVLTEVYKFPFKEFSLIIELLTFQLKSHGKEKIDKLFFNPIDDLTPLIYFNNNLFNNYSIFDPNIMRNIKTSQVLNQMIGYIKILSENTLIDFNSDRSQFLQNELTDSLNNFLLNINKKIQEIGSENKYHLVGFDILKQTILSSDYIDLSNQNNLRDIIKDDFVFKNKVKITIKKEKVLYSLFGKAATLKIIDEKSSSSKNETQEKNPIPVKIILNCKDELEINIPSDQIDLKNIINSVYDSNGELVDNDIVKIKIDGKNCKNSILHSITDTCEKNIEYIYHDKITGDSIRKIKLKFIEPVSKFKTTKYDDLLIYINTREKYNINFNKILNRLVDQINQLKLKNYREIISCSLRPIFELSVASINKSEKYLNKFNRLLDLENGVVEIVSYIKSKKDYLRIIDDSTKIGFRTLNNLLNIENFRTVVSAANLGSHHSSTFLSDKEIRNIAKYAAIFIVIVNEMINNSKIK